MTPQEEVRRITKAAERNPLGKHQSSLSGAQVPRLQPFKTEVFLQQQEAIVLQLSAKCLN